MSHPKSFRLSDEAISILKEKAKYFGLSQTKFIEAIIMNFTPSTPDEKLMQKRKRDEAFDNFKKTNPDPSISKTWQNGFKHGWIQFQSRKIAFDNIFKKLGI